MMSQPPDLLRQELTYAAYLDQWAQTVEQPLKGLDRTARRYRLYARYNFERQARVHAEYQMSDALREAVEGIQESQRWMVLTEDWCVDSAYFLPVIAEAAALNEQIDLRLLMRDENLDLMDQYLTRGGRSIPKLVVFSADGSERFTWGPRPVEAQRYRDALVAEGVEGQDISTQLIQWIEAQEAWTLVDAELVALMEQPE